MFSLTFSLNFLISVRSSEVISCCLVYVSVIWIQLLISNQSTGIPSAWDFFELLADFSFHDADIKEVIQGVF